MNTPDAEPMHRQGMILDTAIAALNADALPFTRIEGTDILATDWAGENGTWMCYVHAQDRDVQLLIYSVMIGAVPAERRPAVAEFLTRVNYYMAIGNFEMDYDEGEIRYKTSVDVEGDRLSVAMARRLFKTNVATMDLFLPGIEAVIRGDGSPAEVLASLK
ncbi:MAG: YbjN domain-containing protein [Thermomicrobiales bacterium]